jgi:hypothetical protein
MASNRIQQNKDATPEAAVLDRFLQSGAQITALAESIERIGSSASLSGDFASFNATFGLPAPTPGAEDAEYNIVMGAVGSIVQAGSIRTLLERMGKY